MSAWTAIPLFFCLSLSFGVHVQAFTARQMVYPGQNEFLELSIIHINDFHARFVETNPTSGTCRDATKGDCVGGYARVVTASRELLEERPNAILLNAGDHFQGTLWHTVHRWNASVHFLNKLPWDAITIENHDFDDDIGGLVPFLQRVQAPIVATNIDDSGEPDFQGYHKNSTVIVRGGKKIGIIGVIIQSTNTLSKTGKLQFLDEVETVNEEAAKLRAEGVDVIIVLSHCGLDVDRVMAAECPDIDVIVGGHSHTFLYTGQPPFSDNPADEYPVVVKQDKTDRTVLIVQAAAFTKYVGNLTVWFDTEGEVVDWQGNPILLDRLIVEDPEIVEELKIWKRAVDEIGQQEVGETVSKLSANCRNGECNLANLLTDAMVYAFQNKTENPTVWTRAAISCTNAGGIRGSIEPGKITYSDIATIQPFDNTWDLVDLKGEDLYTAFEESVSRGGKGPVFTSAAFLHWSGVKLVYNLSQPAYSRLISAQVECQECAVPKYEDIETDKWYRIVVPTFVLERGDNLTTIADKHRNHEPGNLDITQIVDYLLAISPFDYKLDQRVQMLGQCCG